MSPSRSAPRCQGKSVKLSPSKNVKLCQESAADQLLWRSVRMWRGKSAEMWRGRTAVTLTLLNVRRLKSSNVSLFPRKNVWTNLVRFATLSQSKHVNLFLRKYARASLDKNANIIQKQSASRYLEKCVTTLHEKSVNTSQNKNANMCQKKSAKRIVVTFIVARCAQLSMVIDVTNIIIILVIGSIMDITKADPLHFLSNQDPPSRVCNNSVSEKHSRYLIPTSWHCLHTNVQIGCYAGSLKPEL